MNLVGSNHFLQFFFYSICFGIFISCKNQSQNKSKSKTTVEYATNFNIIKHKTYTEFQILNPENKTVEKKYALITIENKNEIPKNIIPIKTPLKSIVCLAGTDIGMINKLNQIKKIIGITNFNYVYNKELKSKNKKNKLLEIDDLNNFNPENLFNKTKLITYSGFNHKMQNEDKFNLLHIELIPIYDWREKHPLGKAEWIKLYGLLFHKEKEAFSYFEKIKNEYLKLTKIASAYKKKPKVLSGSLIGDTWFMPAGNSFNAKLIKDANGEYVNKLNDKTGSTPYHFEEVLTKFGNANIWINPMFESKNKMTTSNSKYRYFESFKNNSIFCYSSKMNYFWENSAIEPHKVLSDLIQIFHNQKVKENKLYFYKKIN